ncbi:MAG: KEOPS complex subunit Pcc1 [Ignisphaera sp.]
MIISIAVQIPTNSKEICKIILESLEPDNVEIPKGIAIEMSCHQGMLVVGVKSEDVGILTVRNTVDDILAYVNLALKSISSINMR